MSGFTLKNPVGNGVPNPRYFRPLVRENAIVQDAPSGYKIDPCFLPNVAVQGALAGTAPPTQVNAVTPTNNIGGDTLVLGNPAAWGTFVAPDGTPYVFPLYNPV